MGISTAAAQRKPDTMKKMAKPISMAAMTTEAGTAGSKIG
jgi:hypothetical protein